MSIQIFQQKIFLVAGGTNCNDIYDSIMESSRQYNVNSNSLEKEKYPKLDEIGIKESLLIAGNPENKNILGINDISSINPNILSCLELSAIETALILYNSKFENATIYPVPFLSLKSSVHNTISLDKLKELLGGRNNFMKYWNKRNLPQNMNSLKKKVPKINWRYTSDKISFREHNMTGFKVVNKLISKSSMSGFSFKKFLDTILYPMIKENMNVPSNNAAFSDTTLYNNSMGKILKPVIIVANYDTIRSFLDQVKNKKFSQKEHIIERSSVWEVELKIMKKFEFGRVVYEYEFINHTKRYPTEFVSKNLTMNNNTFTFKYKNKTYELIPSNKNIPIRQITSLECKSCKEGKKMVSILKEIDGKMNPKKNNNKSTPQEVLKTDLNLTKNYKNYSELLEGLTQESSIPIVTY